MKKYLFLFLFTLHISLLAQNFMINGKFSKPFNEHYERAYILEAVFATNNNAYSIGVFLGVAKVNFNFEKYWASSYSEATTKYITGIITYIYPLYLTNLDVLQRIYLSFTWATIADYGVFPGGGYMFPGTGYVFPNSKNEKIWIISSGYKIPFKSVNFLLGLGYQHREYNLEFDEYDNNNYVNTHIIHQIEKSLQIDIALQYIF